MRYALLIPAFLLFLSYIPFVHKMEMKEMMAVMKQSGCCKKMKGEKAESKCNMKDASCVCICGFQYVAPDQITEKPQLGIEINTYELRGYLQHLWKDPQLAAPWQPPDVS